MATSNQTAIDGQQYSVNFKQSINTDNIAEKVYPFSDGIAPHIVNTGICRDDGITNLYRDDITTLQDFVSYAPNGKKVSISYADNSLWLDNAKVGTVGPYGLKKRTALKNGALDVALTSTDTWLILNKSFSTNLSESFTTTTAPGGNWVDVAYGSGVWVAIASTNSTAAGVFRSTDNGISWSAVTTTAPGGKWSSVTYGNGVFVLTAESTSTSSSVARSDDGGVTWSFVTTPTNYFTGWTCGTFGNGMFLIGNKSNAVVKSSPHVITSGSSVPIYSGHPLIVTTANTGQGIAISPDNGSTWSMVASTEAQKDWRSIAFGNGIFLAISQDTTDQTIYRSTDNGSTWSKIYATEPAGYRKAISFGNGWFFTVADTTSTTAGVQASSDGGLTWSFVTVPTPGGNWVSIDYCNGFWELLAATTSATAGVFRSFDNGVSWVAVTTTTPGGNWIVSGYGNGIVTTLAATTSITAGVLKTSQAQVQSYNVQEYDPITETVLNTKTLSTSFVDKTNYACFVKSHGMTFNSADVAYIYFSVLTVTCAVFVSGVSKTVFSATGKPQLFTGLSAFKNGGTYIVGGVPDNTTMPKSYYAASPYSSWTGIIETSYLSNYEDFSTIGSGVLNLIGIPSSISTANWSTFGTKVSIATNGTVTKTTVTQTGLAVVPSDTYSGFGFSSGKFKSTAATKFSPFILDNARIPITITETVTDYGVKPQSVCSIGSTTGQKVFIHTVSGKPSQLVWGGFYGTMPITDYGDLLTAPVCQWKDSIGKYTVTVQGSKSIFLAEIESNSYEIFPISSDVVQISDSFGTILDTTNGTTELNGGSQTPGFISDIYLTGSNQLAYQTTTRFSNAVDFGSVDSVAGVSSVMSASTISGAIMLPLVIYQGATAGSLFANVLYSGGTQIATDTSVAYVTNSNLPPAVDTVYSSGGMSFLSTSAVQTINYSDSYGYAQYYAGYTIGNTFPIDYQFFNLFGQIYGFDGTKIFSIPVNGATAWTPQQIAVASGLSFIANSPTQALFHSSFDNSLYSFDGGRKVEKVAELTGLSMVEYGVYETKESSFYLQLDDATVLLIRDGIYNLVDAPYNNQRIVSTDYGIRFVNNDAKNTSCKYTYFAGSGTELPLIFQSGFYGFGLNQWARVSYVVFTLRVPTPATTDLTVTYNWLNSYDNGLETSTYLAGYYEASSTGYVRLKYNPQNPLVNGVSVGIKCDRKIYLYDIIIYYTDGGIAQVPNQSP